MSASNVTVSPEYSLFELGRGLGRLADIQRRLRRLFDEVKVGLVALAAVGATGKNMDRVERVLLLRGQGSVTEHIRKQHPGLRVLTGADAGLLGSFPANGNLLDHIYIVDPLGNVMMRYPITPDPSGILKDINRLMYVSQVG